MERMNIASKAMKKQTERLKTRKATLGDELRVVSERHQTADKEMKTTLEEIQQLKQARSGTRRELRGKELEIRLLKAIRYLLSTSVQRFHIHLLIFV